MKGSRILLFIMLTAAMLSGCSETAMDTSNKIVPPDNRVLPIQGRWIIDKCLTEGEKSGDNSYDSKWLGKSAWFTNESASMSSSVWRDVSYKMKRVDAAEYFLHKYREPAENLGVTDREIFIITLSSGEKFLYEYIYLNETELVVNIDDDYYRMRRVNDQVGEKLAEGTGYDLDTEEKNQAAEDKTIRSGILLGIRRLTKPEDTDNGDSLKDYTYLTLWIAAQNRELRPLMQAEGIFLPRRNGFWKVEIDRLNHNNITEDLLNAYSVSGSEAVEPRNIRAINSFWKDREGTLEKIINFIGNDYASLQLTGSGKLADGESWKINKLATLPVDNLDSNKGVRISDIVGENGTLAVENAVNDMLNVSNIKRIKRPETAELERSFSLYRKTGHWFIKGRLELLQNESVPYTDYNINIIPPPSLVAYDELLLPWTTIKDRIPDANDAFTSPNRDIAVVVTKTQLLVYLITGDTLAEAPLAKLNLQEGDTVIMSEWGLGTYVEKWERAFVKYNNAVPAGQ